LGGKISERPDVGAKASARLLRTFFKAKVLNPNFDFKKKVKFSLPEDFGKVDGLRDQMMLECRRIPLSIDPRILADYLVAIILAKERISQKN
jgi:hypothetical protein